MFFSPAGHNLQLADTILAGGSVYFLKGQPVNYRFPFTGIFNNRGPDPSVSRGLVELERNTFCFTNSDEFLIPQ